MAGCDEATITGDRWRGEKPLICLDFAPMHADPSPPNRPRHQRTLAAAFWIAIFFLGGLSNVLVAAVDAWREGQAFHWWPSIISQGSSIMASLMVLPVLLLAVRRWPLQLDNWKLRLAPYLLGSVVWTLAHVLLMVALRTLAHAAMGGHYDYGPWAANLLYEYGKDARDYVLIVSGVHAFDWFQRQRQGEARMLVAPDAGLPTVPEAQPERPQRFLVRKLGRDFLIDVESIDFAQASGNYVNLHVGGRVYPLRSTMAAFQDKLDPARFVRVHRSHLVNLARIASIEPLESGDARIHLHDGTTLPCSRRYRAALRV